MSQQDAKHGETGTNRRRSQRVLLDVPLIVQGETADRHSFQEETFTVAVSAHGALLVLAARVALGQKLLLTKPKTWEEQEGRVAYLGPPYAGLSQVGIDFARPAPEFWPIATAPDDWKTLH